MVMIMSLADAMRLPGAERCAGAKPTAFELPDHGAQPWVLKSITPLPCGDHARVEVFALVAPRPKMHF